MSPHDRTGELVEPHDPACRRGWLGSDSEGRPIPCLICRPHLARRSEIHDTATQPITDRARRAIQEDNRNA